MNETTTASISFDDGETWTTVEVLPIATDLSHVGQLLAVGSDLPIEATQLLRQIAEAEAMAKDLVINDPETLKFWDSAIAGVKDWYRQIEEGRKRYTRPIDAIKGEMMDRVRPITDRLSALTDRIGAAITAYYQEQARRDVEAATKRQAEIRKQREDTALAQAAKLEAQGRPQAAQQVLNMAATAPVPPSQVPPTIPAKIGHVRMETFVAWAIENSDELPRKFLIPDERAIQKMVDAFGMKTDIPGVVVWPEERIAAVRRRPMKR